MQLCVRMCMHMGMAEAGCVCPCAPLRKDTYKNRNSRQTLEDLRLHRWIHTSSSCALKLLTKAGITNLKIC